MRNFVQSRRLKALFALVFLSFVGVEANAQDTVTVSYTHTFARNATYCSTDAQFSDWVTYLDSIETLQATGDFRFIEAKYSSTDASTTKEHVYDGVDIDPFITDLVSLDTTAIGGVGSANYLSSGGDQWYITSGCEVSGAALASCASGTYPRIAVEINPVTPFGCNPNVESALRPAIGNSSWGGSFGATSPQSVSVTGPDETITFSVRYVDAAAPIPVCYTDTVNVYVDEFGGYTLQTSDIDSASYDEFLNPTLPGSPTVGWGIETYALSSSVMTCDSIGPRHVQLTITDYAGNDSTCTTIINVLDTLNPNAFAADTTVYLNGAGSISIDATYLNAGSYDNCNAGGLIYISDTVFTCTGVFSDTLVMIDGSGNTDTAYAMVTVLDTVAPTANCIAGPFELYLDSNGVAVLTADSLDDGSTDNVTCSSLNFSVNIDTFYCADAYTTDGVGPIDVILTVTDSSGNSSTCTTQVEVYDTIAPNPDVLDSLTVYVNQSGIASIDSAALDVSSADNCQLSFLDIDILTVGCDSVDSSFYAFVRLEDWYGNVSDEDSVYITVLDTIAPVLDLNDTIFAYLDGSGNYTLDSATVDNATADNCTGFTLNLGQTAFDCSEAGDTIAVLVTATDLDNTPSVSTQNVYVVLQDTVAPVITVATADTLYLDASGIVAIDSNAFATATDACGVLSIAVDVDSLFCSQLVFSPGAIISTATDSNGNVSTGSTLVTLLDTLNPTIVLQNINVYLDVTGNAILDSNAFDNGSTDNCAIDSFALSLNAFDCSFINATNDSNVTVTTYVWDASNNLDSNTAIATIMDTIAPVVTCTDTVVYLDANGMAIIDSSYVMDNVIDNCPSTLTYAISQDTITCADYDTVLITLTVTDAQGNIGTCVSTVTVMDTLVPVALANNVTIYSDSMGIAKLDSQFVRDIVDNGSYDNCSFELTVSDSIFDCSQEGLNLVTLTATDIAGNIGTVDFFVTVDDTIKPQAIGKNVTVALNDNGMVSIDPSLIDSASWDNCMDNLTFDLSQANFDCSNLGANTITFSVQDGNGQADSMDVVITIIDQTLPNAIAQNIVVYLDGAGQAVISAGDVDNGSVDNCALDSMWVSKDTLTCDDLGVTPISLFVADVNGNQNSAAALVTVMDTIAPTVVTQNVTLYLDSAGNIPTVDVALFENGSSDNCGFTAELLTKIDYDCTHAGINSVDLKYSDNAGNEVIVSATLTIVDSIAPVAIAQDIAVELDANGTVTISPALINNNSYDDCTSLTYALDVTSFDCSNIGANPIVLTVTDGSGNISTASAVVTVSDVTAPVISLNAITRSLDANGDVTVTAADFDNGTSDACGIASTTIDVTAFDCTNTGLNTITFTATDVNGNVSTGTTTLTIVDDVLPTVVGQDVTAYLNADGNVTISVSDVDNGSTDNCDFALSIDIKDFDCTMTGTNDVILTGVDASGNTSAYTVVVTVMDTISPMAVAQDILVELDANGNATITTAMINNNSSDNCAGLTYALDVTSFDCSNIGANPVVLTVTDASSNVSTASAVVTVSDVTAPVISLNAITRSLDLNGDVTVTAADFDNGTSDACGIASTTIDVTTFDCTNTGLNTITFTATDVNGNVSTGTTTLTIVDDIVPVVVGQDVTAYLNADGNVTISVSDVDNNSFDNCDFALSIDIKDFDCTMTGTNDVILTGVDASGNTSADTVVVTVMDTISPMAVAQDISVELDAAGSATITAAMINNNSSDNCAGLTYALDVTSFDCTNIGANTVTLTVTDASSNVSTATAVVTVSDVTSPVVSLNALTRSLDANGDVVVTAADFDNGTSDACGIASTTIDLTAFDCTNIGLNTITFTATDVNGNVSTGTTTLTIVDDESPIVKGQDVTAYLNAAGNVTISVSDIDNGSTDNCDLSLSIDMMNFDCTMTGTNDVILTGVDGSGNTSADTVTVTVMDTISPMAVAQDISVELDALGSATITTAMINNNSSDNCAGLTYALDVTSFDCTNIGANTVTLTVTDASSNVSTATAVVTVSDVTSSVVSLNALTRSLDANGDVVVTAADFDNGTSDACGIASTTIDLTAFDCTNIGLNTITFTATDVNGNVSTGTTTLTIVDDMAPSVVGQDFTANLNADGNVTISVSDIDNGSTDNCGLSLSIDMMNFDCTMTGANDVILTGVDPSGNTSADTVTVTVVDDILPTAIAQNVTAELDETGVATITPEMVDNGSFDNCSGITLSLSNTTYACFLAGTTQNVSLQVTDASGNTSFASAVVTIVDNIAPTVAIQPIERTLDASGSVTVTAADFNNGTSDNCGIASTTIDLTSFDCSHVGNNTITFTATDNSGNVSTGTTTLTIADDSLPMAITQDITVQLNAEGNVDITADMVDNGSSDNCNFTTSIDVSSFDCTNIGTNDVVLTVTDEHGNVSTSTAVVTVEDNITPNVSTVATYTVELDATGNATITPEQLNLSSSDNCPSGGLTFHFSNGFDGTLSCSDIDDNGKNVYVFVKDAAGNISSTQLTVVTIVDATAPVVATNNITRALDASGNVTVTAADFDNGTSDACGIDELTVTPSSFDCSNVGVNTLTFTATDVNGNATSNTVYLTIEDNTAPTIVGQDITVSLDGNGNAVIDAQALDNGTSDNCDFDLAINTTDFDCSHIGANTVTLTATDVNGNVSTVDVTVTVEDNTNPTAIAQNVTVELDASGNATITTGQINNGSLDNCSSQALTYTLSKTSFDCTNVGANTVTLTATDASGNSSDVTATVTVEDNMNPVVASQNIGLVLDATGNASIDVATFNHGATDNCGIASFTLSNTDFDCTHIGINTITLTVTDNNGNVSTADVFVTVADETNPTIVSLPFGAAPGVVIGECDANGFVYDLPTFDDNCGVVSVALSSGLPSGAIFPVGITTITYIATDASGNAISATVTVEVQAQGTPSDLPASAQVCPDGDNIDLGTDATFSGAGVVGTVFDPSVAGEGVHELTWTYTDANGCVISGTITMTVYPTATTPVVTQTGSTTLTASNNGYDTYQWYRNGNELTGQTGQTLSINSAGNYQVRGYTINGCSSLSAALNIGGGVFDVVPKGYDIAETAVYPNPTTGKVFVDLGETLETVSIEVFDARGAKVKTFNFENMTSSTVEIELSELPSAMYHVVISNDVQVTTKKIVINK